MADDDVNLESEVTSLSTRLIEAIDRQADLEDQVKMLRRELDGALNAKAQLEADIQGAYVPKEQLTVAQSQRKEAEDQVTSLNGEIEDLTGKLFEEANNMVADAKRETAESNRVNDHLQMQINEKDALLEHMQQQLVALKAVLQELTEQEGAHNEVPSRTVAATPPPGIRTPDRANSPAIGLNGADSATSSVVLGSATDTDSDVTYWTLNDRSALHASVRPLLRRDIPPYDDFKDFIQRTGVARAIRTSMQPSLATSTPGAFPSASPRASTPESPSTSTSTASRLHMTASLNSASQAAPAVSLKEYKLFKRCVADDIEPTLRLDLAPGLSWLARRSVMNGIVEGTAVVEPISGFNEGTRAHPSGMYNTDRVVATKTPCTLCGETRDSSFIYLRLHNLRIGGASRSTMLLSGTSTTTTSSTNGTTTTTTTTTTTSSLKDETSATSSSTSSSTRTNGSSSSSSVAGVVSSGYPLCHYCLGRVRSVCDFVAFLKSVRDRVWKVDSDEAEQRAWEELCRLRERMLWARVGGVFPPGMLLGPSLAVGLKERREIAAEDGDLEADDDAGNSTVEGESGPAEVAEEGPAPGTPSSDATDILNSYGEDDDGYTTA